MLDKKDDPQAGVKSTALLFGEYARTIMMGLTVLFVAGFTSIGILTQQNVAFYALNVAGTGLFLGRQVWTVDFDDPQSCMERFLENGGKLGYLLWGGFLTSYLLQFK